MKEKPDLLNNQAILLAKDGNFTDAIAFFKRAITLDKNNYLLWFNLGVTYRDAGELELAKESLDTAFSIAPQIDDVSETYATICLTLKEYSLVQTICETGLDFNPLNTHLWNLLGVINFQTEKYDEAAEYFEQAVYINPYYLDGLYNLKDTYNVLQNKAGEQECLNKIMEIEKK